MAKGYDSIVLMTPKGMSDFRVRGKMPRSVELNVLEVSEAETYGNGTRTINSRQARRQAAGPV